jgi:23S rRNA (adenine2030-N6)-methyltransferase
VNYRHHFHAGNFADAMKHALLAELVRGLQRKETGLLLLDTHAGRGRYDLEAAARGDSLARQPEWPDGLGRLWERADLPPALAAYVALVRDFDRRQGNLTPAPRFHPGSPRLLEILARPQDRAVFCELEPGESAALRGEFLLSPRTEVRAMDGYTAVRALLPPPERRALVLIDPSYERPDEPVQIVGAIRDGLRRLPAGTFAIWYPLSPRARPDELLDRLAELPLPPTLVAELVVNPASPTMAGCGLAILNPPWQFDRVARPLLDFLGKILAQAPDAGGHLRWLVPEK